MKKHSIHILLWLTIGSLHATESRAQGAQVVNGKHVRQQLERQVVTRWNGFDPKWYFVLFHNKYRTGADRRNMLQLMPAMAAVRRTQAMAEREEREVNTVFEQELFKAADRSLNKSFHLIYSNKIASLNREIDLLSAEAVAARVDVGMLFKLHEQRERINADIELTKEAYEEDSAKAAAFRGYMADLVSLRGYYRRIINLVKTANKLDK